MSDLYPPSYTPTYTLTPTALTTTLTTASGATGIANPNHHTGGAEPAPPHPHQPKPSAYAWLLAWLMLAVILTLINRTRFGHTAIYYTLLLLIFFVLVSNYRFITNALSPFQTTVAQAS